MSGYECKKCGMGASSKCVNQRHVFPGDMLATCIGNMIRIDAYRMGSKDERYTREADSDKWTVKYTFEATYISAQDEDEAIKVARIDELLLTADRESLRKGLCDHDWTIMPGQTCMFGCCVGEPVESAA